MYSGIPSAVALWRGEGLSILRNEKIFLNWMFNYDESIKYICFLENDLDIDYKQDLFLEKLITKIKGSARKRSDSILKRAYNLLMEDEKRVIGILTLRKS